MKDKKKSIRPIYKTAFCIEEALYETPDAKEPICSRRLQGRFSLDLLRLAVLGTAAAVASAVLTLALTHGKND